MDEQRPGERACLRRHARSARALGLLFVALVAVVGVPPGQARAHDQAQAGSPWAGVLERDCSYYSAYYAGAHCSRVPTRRPAANAFAGAGSERDVFEGPVPRADCGPGSRPETALQGEVPQADRDSGRSAQGYTCNLEVVGNYRGEGSTWSAAYYGHCAYYSTYYEGTQTHRGVVVVDASDPAHPKLAGTLTSPAMLSPHESLKVHAGRGLLAAVTGGELTASGTFEVYDVAGDCARPKLLGSAINPLGHEGNWAPDGRTYYASGGASFLSAIDVTDPRTPRTITTLLPPGLIHGLGVSEDGNSLYLAHVNPDFLTEIFAPGWPHGATDSNGMGIYDVSQIQARNANPSARLVGEVNWTDGSVGQHAIPIRSAGRPYVVFVDEFGWGGPRIIDVGDERHPRVISKLKLEIQMPENRERAVASTHAITEDGTGAIVGFGYNSHYCNVDRDLDPTLLACANFESGIRVFDIRDVRHPREIAYFNSGGDGRRAPASFGGATSSYVVTQPRILPDGQIWFTDQDRGLYILRFTNDAWPLRTRCRGTLRVSVRDVLGARRARGLRRATVYVDGRRIRTLRGRRLRRPLTIRNLSGESTSVRVVARRRDGRRVARTRVYSLCGS